MRIVEPLARVSPTAVLGGTWVIAAAVGAQPPQCHGVGRDDQQGPERVGRNEEHLAYGGKPTAATASHRAGWLPAQTPAAASNCMAPRLTMTQPQARRPP